MWSYHLLHMLHSSSAVQAWRLTGDVYSKKPGDKPWISEMYGYSFGAAKAGVWHKYDEESMLYPGYVPNGEPKMKQRSLARM